MWKLRAGTLARNRSKPLKAPLDVSLPSRYDLDRGAMSPRPGPLGASAKCVGERALGAAGARYGVVGTLQLEGGAGWVSVSR
jgi:hypothetical protein